VHIKDSLDEDLHKEWVSHFPDGEGATLEKLLNAIYVVLEYKPSPLACFGHTPEDGSLCPPIDYITLKLPVHHFSGCVAAICKSDFSLQLNFITCVTQTAQSSNFDLV